MDAMFEIIGCYVVKYVDEHFDHWKMLVMEYRCRLFIDSQQSLVQLHIWPLVFWLHNQFAHDFRDRTKLLPLCHLSTSHHITTISMERVEFLRKFELILIYQRYRVVPLSSSKTIKIQCRALVYHYHHSLPTSAMCGFLSTMLASHKSNKKHELFVVFFQQEFFWLQTVVIINIHTPWLAVLFIVLNGV